jgi:hypothetical protein
VVADRRHADFQRDGEWVKSDHQDTETPSFEFPLRIGDFGLHRISAGQVVVKGKRWQRVVELESARRARARRGRRPFVHFVSKISRLGLESGVFNGTTIPAI